MATSTKAKSTAKPKTAKKKTPRKPVGAKSHVPRAVVLADCTEKEMAFCARYIVDFNATQAYRDVFGAELKSPETLASRLLCKPQVAKQIRALTTKALNNAQAQAQRAVDLVAARAFFRPADFLHIDENGKPSLDLSKLKDRPELMDCLNVKIKQAIDGFGGVHELYEVTPHDSGKALDMLFKYHKLYNDNSEAQTRPIHVSFNFPAPGSNWQQPVHATSEPIDG